MGRQKRERLPISDDILKRFHLSRDKTRVKLCKDITVEDLEYLKDVPKLDSVTFYHGGIVDAAVLTRLSHLNLQYLKIGRWNQCTDKDLAALACLRRLKKLNLSCGCNISNTGLIHLQNLPNLSYLCLYCNDKITDRGMANIQSLRNLTQLCVRLTGRITDAGLYHIEKLEQLRILHVSGSDRITGEGLMHLERLKCLRELRVSGSWTEAGIVNLARLPRLSYLYLNNWRFLGKYYADFFKRYFRNTNVCVSGINICDLSPKAIQGLEYLRSVLDALSVPKEFMPKIRGSLMFDRMDMDEAWIRWELDDFLAEVPRNGSLDSNHK